MDDFPKELDLVYNVLETLRNKTCICSLMLALKTLAHEVASEKEDVSKPFLEFDFIGLDLI